MNGRARTPRSRRSPGVGFRVEPPPRTRDWVLRAGVVSILAWVVLSWVSPPAAVPWTEPMISAAEEMARGLGRVADHCRRENIPIDPLIDPNQTCLVGPQLTPLLTTLGQLEAKRTALSPDVAGLLVHLLAGAGVTAGDSVAVGASGSFPGLLVATLAAVRALDAHPVSILSLGASSYGATRPGFHLLDLYEILEGEGGDLGLPAAVSLGGGGDVGEGFDPDLREELRRQVLRAGVPFLEEPELTPNVVRRMEIYGKPAAFVNIGGAEANLGTSPLVLQLPAGPVGPRHRTAAPSLPPEDQQGVIFAMVERQVPVIHLLNLRGLAVRYGLGWDPIPLPPPGFTPLKDSAEGPGWRFWLLTLLYLGTLVGLAWVPSRRSPSATSV